MVEKCLCVKDYKKFIKGKEYRCEMERYIVFDNKNDKFTIGEFEFDEYFKEIN